MVILLLIIIFLFIFDDIYITLIIKYYFEYWKNCPFTITDDYNLHYQRRCELYNINENSSYLYQYICSYDPSGDFQYKYKRQYSTVSKRTVTKKKIKKLTKKIEPDCLKCVELNNIITNNTVVTLFINEYENTDKYYCSRTNKPEKNILINDEDCKNDTKYVFLIILYCFYYFKIFCIIGYFVYLYVIKPSIDDKNNSKNKNNNKDLNKMNSDKISNDIKNVDAFDRENNQNNIRDNKEKFNIEKDIKKIKDSDYSSEAISDEVKIKNVFDNKI